MGGTMRCPNCRSDKLVEIAIKVAADADNKLRFHSCRACEHKWWEREGTSESVPLNAVLEMARVRKTA